MNDTVGNQSQQTGDAGNPSGQQPAAPASIEKPIFQPPDRTQFFMGRLAEMDKKLNSVLDAVSRSTQTNQQLEAEQKIERAMAGARAQVQAAEQDLVEAYKQMEENPGGVAMAQRKLAEAAARVERIDSEASAIRRSFEQRQPDERTDPEAGNRWRQSREGDADQGGQGDAGDASNLNAWKAQNDWYGTDQEMTKASHEIDANIRGAGVLEVGSVEYFQAVDRQMRKRFPNKFREAGGDPALAGGGDTAGDLAGPGGSTTLRMTPEMQRAAERWNMTPEEWAKFRNMAVEQGKLPKEPEYGSVRTS